MMCTRTRTMCKKIFPEASNRACTQLILTVESYLSDRNSSVVAGMTDGSEVLVLANHLNEA